MQTRTITLAANVVSDEQIPSAKFFMLLETVGPVDVELVSVDGSSSEIAEGVESGFKVKAGLENERISRAKITSTTAQTIKIGYSVRDVDNKKVTSTVSVVDGGESRVKNSKAFAGYIFLAASATNYAHLQWLNPAGSGKRMIINTFLVTNYGAVGSISAKYYDTALTTDFGDGLNKLAGGAADTDTQLRVESKASTIAGNTIWHSRVAQDETKEIKLSEPIILEPGKGLVVFTSVVNASLDAAAQYYIEDE